MTRYFAEIKNNVVLRIIVADSVDWCIENLGGTWKETFKKDENKNYARIGDTYNEEKKNFISPKPFKSWELDEKCVWQPPVKKPKDFLAKWDEDSLTWKKIN